MNKEELNKIIEETSFKISQLAGNLIYYIEKYQKQFENNQIITINIENKGAKKQC